MFDILESMLETAQFIVKLQTVGQQLYTKFELLYL